LPRSVKEVSLKKFDPASAERAWRAFRSSIGIAAIQTPRQFAKPKRSTPNPCIVRAKVSVTRYPVSVTASSRFFPKFPEFLKQFLCLNRCEGEAFPGRFQERFLQAEGAALSHPPPDKH
jgi:hypothetical protein